VDLIFKKYKKIITIWVTPYHYRFHKIQPKQKNVETLATFWNDKDSLTWQSMEQLYKIDMKTFISL